MCAKGDRRNGKQCRPWSDCSSLIWVCTVCSCLSVPKHDFYQITLLQEDTSGLRHIDPKTKEVKYNPKYDELFAAQVSPMFFSYFAFIWKSKIGKLQKYISWYDVTFVLLFTYNRRNCKYECLMDVTQDLVTVILLICTWMSHFVY